MEKLTSERLDREGQRRVLLDALVAARRRAGVSQRQLAARLRRAHSFVAKIELGTRQLRVLELLEYADALEVDPMELLRQINAALDQQAQCCQS